MRLIIHHNSLHSAVWWFVVIIDQSSQRSILSRCINTKYDLQKKKKINGWIDIITCIAHQHKWPTKIKPSEHYLSICYHDVKYQTAFWYLPPKLLLPWKVKQKSTFLFWIFFLSWIAFFFCNKFTPILQHKGTLFNGFGGKHTSSYSKHIKI